MPLLVILISLLLLPPELSQAGTSSQGPTSEEESAILWTDGSQAFEDLRFDDSVRLLSRLVDRYPAHPNYLQAQLTLGRALIDAGHPREALKPLLAYIEAKGSSTLALRARLWRGEAQLKLNLLQEALLTATELEKTNEKKSPEIKFHALTLKTRVLDLMNRQSRADESLRLAEQLAERQKDLLAPYGKEINAELMLLRIEHKLMLCNKFLLNPVNDESAAIDQMDRRIICLDEAQLLFQKMPDLETRRQLLKATQAFKIASEQILKLAANPKLALKKGARTAPQYDRAAQELSQKFSLDSRKKLKDLLERTLAWQSKTPVYQELIKELEALSQGGKS